MAGIVSCGSTRFCIIEVGRGPEVCGEKSQYALSKQQNSKGPRPLGRRAVRTVFDPHRGWRGIVTVRGEKDAAFRRSVSSVLCRFEGKEGGGGGGAMSVAVPEVC